MKIFISYASEERPIADELAVRLRTEGHTVFLDQDNLPEGEGYDAQIRAAIASCDLYLFLVSPLSVQPGRYTITELKFAREQFPNPKGRVLPVMIKPTPFSDIPPYLSAITIKAATQPQDGLLTEKVVLSVVDELAMASMSDPRHIPTLKNLTTLFSFLGDAERSKLAIKLAEDAVSAAPVPAYGNRKQ